MKTLRKWTRQPDRNPEEPTPIGIADALQLALRVDRELAMVRRDQSRTLNRLKCWQGRARPRATRRLCARINTLSARQHLLESLRPSGQPRPDDCVLSSWALRDSYAICTETPDEGMHFIVGVEIDGLTIGTGLAEFAYARRSIAGAAGEHAATHRLTIEAAETGHEILAIAHSHPGVGPGSNHPSETDLATHRLWEQSRNIIGAIWSRDGFVRFFTAGHPFRVRIVGHHLEHIDENLWKLHDEFMPRVQ